jgi:hypothetical protein
VTTTPTCRHSDRAPAVRWCRRSRLAIASLAAVVWIGGPTSATLAQSIDGPAQRTVDSQRPAPQRLPPALSIRLPIAGASPLANRTKIASTTRLPSPAVSTAPTARLLLPVQRLPSPELKIESDDSTEDVRWEDDVPWEASSPSVELARSMRLLHALDDCGPADFDCPSVCPTETIADDFSPTRMAGDSMYHDGGREQWVYDEKSDVPTQRPWIEWGRMFYGDGITPRGINLWGDKNLARPQFYVYGDFRSGIATGRNAAGRIDNWANRLNLDLDLQLTDTERFHSFIGPLDDGGQFTRLERVDGEWRWETEMDLTPLTGYFEGDLGVLLGTVHGDTSPFELPFTIGLVPLLFQNGIWMEDGVTGAAFALPARHSRLLNWSNYDATFFAVVDQLNSAAFGNNVNAAQAFGTAWFIEAYGGYIESGYAYLRDRNQNQRSYHNITASFTRRYWDRISNSVRVIVNAGQELPQQDRTADGVLLLVENSLITASPLTVVPYANFFVGWDRPQSVARAAASGGILRNTGINFDTDGLNGFPTLDPTAADTAGGSLGIDLLGQDLDRQLLLEAAFLAPHGNDNPLVPSDQYAVGTRYQFPITNWSLLRFDAMYGWRRGLQDIYGTRMEYRWKF